MQIRRCLLLAGILASSAGPAWAQRDGRSEERRQAIDSNAAVALDELLNAQASVRDVYGRAAGYAVFTVTRGGFIASGGGGSGVVVDNATGQRTYVNIGMGGVGLGIGGQSYKVVVLFETTKQLGKFLAEGWDTKATMAQIPDRESVADPSSFVDGVAIYQVTDKGVMAQADISGTRVWVSEELR